MAIKYLHTMVRVRDIDASLNFYCNLLGLKEFRRKEYELGKFTLIFLAPPDQTNAMIELTYNWEQDEDYEIGTAYGHIALGVRGIYDICDKLEAAGVKIPRKPGPVKHGTTHIAFIEDPDGYKIEIVDLDTRTI